MLAAIACNRVNANVGNVTMELIIVGPDRYARRKYEQTIALVPRTPDIMTVNAARVIRLSLGVAKSSANRHKLVPRPEDDLCCPTREQI